MVLTIIICGLINGNAVPNFSKTLKYAIDSTHKWAIVPHELPNTSVCLMGQVVPCSAFRLILK